MMEHVTVNDLDRQIWEEELADFVPEKIFDVHVHSYWSKYINEPFEQCFWGRMGAPEKAGLDEIVEGTEKLFPQRSAFSFLLIPSPSLTTDMEALNNFVAAEGKKSSSAYTAMFVTPEMDPDYVEKFVRTNGTAAFKPYRTFTDDPVECRITDMLPEPIIEVAQQHGLAVVLHIAKRKAIADQQNIDDIRMLADKYKNVTWILAHCARSFALWPLEKAVDYLTPFPNICVDTSAVCESDVFALLFEKIPVQRILFGTDNFPAGTVRGKYITFGRAWDWLNENARNKLSLGHCDPRATFVCYEMLRAIKHGVSRLGLSKDDIEAFFYGNAQAIFSKHNQ